MKKYILLFVCLVAFVSIQGCQDDTAPELKSKYSDVGISFLEGGKVLSEKDFSQDLCETLKKHEEDGTLADLRLRAHKFKVKDLDTLVGRLAAGYVGEDGVEKRSNEHKTLYRKDGKRISYDKEDGTVEFFDRSRICKVEEKVSDQELVVKVKSFVDTYLGAGAESDYFLAEVRKSQVVNSSAGETSSSQGGSTYLGGCEVEEDEVQVGLVRKVDGLPFYDSKSVVVFTFAPSGQLKAFEFRLIDVIDSYTDAPVVSYSEALEDLKKQLPDRDLKNYKLECGFDQVSSSHRSASGVIMPSYVFVLTPKPGTIDAGLVREVHGIKDPAAANDFKESRDKDSYTEEIPDDDKPAPKDG